MRVTENITKKQKTDIKTRWADVGVEEQFLVLEIGKHLSVFIDESELPRFKKALRTLKGYHKTKELSQ